MLTIAHWRHAGVEQEAQSVAEGQKGTQGVRTSSSFALKEHFLLSVQLARKQKVMGRRNGGRSWGHPSYGSLL